MRFPNILASLHAPLHFMLGQYAAATDDAQSAAAHFERARENGDPQLATIAAAMQVCLMSCCCEPVLGSIGG